MDHPRDLAWIDSIDPEIAYQAYEILREVKKGLDLRVDELYVAPRPPKRWMQVLTWQQEEQLTRGRINVCQMLVDRGVLRSQVYVDHRGHVYGGNDGIRIAADEQLVVRALQRLEERCVNGQRHARRRSGPRRPARACSEQQPNSDLPPAELQGLPSTESATRGHPSELQPSSSRVQADFSKGFWGKMGGYAAAVVVAVATILIGWVCDWWTALWRHLSG